MTWKRSSNGKHEGSCRYSFPAVSLSESTMLNGQTGSISPIYRKELLKSWDKEKSLRNCITF